MYLFSSRFNFIKLQLADFLNPMNPPTPIKYNQIVPRLPILPLLSVSTTTSIWSFFLLHCSCNKVFLLSGGVEEDSIIFIKKHETKVTILCTFYKTYEIDDIIYTYLCQYNFNIIEQCIKCLKICYLI